MNISSHANPTLSRRERILELIRQHGFVSIPDLRDALDVSESTIRRDLELLEENGDAKRTHGGVFSTGPSASVRQFGSRSGGQWEKKRSIAIAASSQIEDHETILLDGGSTTYELARQLVGRPLQIVTNSLPVANLFASSDSVDLVLLGGAVHHKTGVTLGSYANDMLRSLNVQKAFLSVAGINQKGFFNSNMLLVETERTMMQCADQTIIVADSSKFGRSSLARLCDWSQVHTLVSDDGLGMDWRGLTEVAKVQLLIAQSHSHELRSDPPSGVSSPLIASAGNIASISTTA
ncbi:MAG: DeoR/GlpR family DNA-binding transcription regulator [Planctomycetes bacterium]|nr:DeoR/GlpR family DNA-binding transcription regulator [Planctomycetota bacterium]